MPPGRERTRPPAIIRWLLARALPAEVRHDVLLDLDEEFQEHQLRARGAAGARWWYRSQALRSLPHALLLRLGSVGGAALAGVDRDLGFSLRALRRSPGASGVVVASLAVGIGAFVLVWGVVEGVVLRPFPYPEPDRLVAVVVQTGSAKPLWNITRGGGGLDFIENVSPPEFADIQVHSRTLERFYTFGDGWDELGTPAGAVAVWTLVGIGGDPFTTLGVEPYLGRGFLRHEITPPGAPVMILSHRVWSRDFGADSSVVGRTFELDREPRVVVGIMPPGVLFHSADVWKPSRSPVPAAERVRDTDKDYQIVARVRDGYDLADVDRELAAISAWMGATYGAEHPDHLDRTFRAVTWTAASVAHYRPVGLLLLAGAGLLLLLIAINVAALLLARSLRRSRELAVRVALGAGRLRLARQLLIEGLVLALLGGGLGTCLALLGLRGAGILLASVGWVHGAPAVGWAVIPAALLVSVGAGILVSLLPALEASTRDVRPHLRTEGPGTSSGGASGRHHFLVVAEVALTVVVLATGAVLARALVEVNRGDPGFDPSRLLTVRLNLPSHSLDERRAFYEELETRLGALPGTAGVGSVQALHPGPSDLTVSLADDGATFQAPVRYASPAYLEALAVPLLSGIPGAYALDPGAGRAALVNRALAERLGGLDEVVGMTGEDTRFPDASDGKFTTVGVVEDLPNEGLLAPPRPEVMIADYCCVDWTVVRTLGPPAELLPAVRAVVRRIDPRVPVVEVATMESRLAREYAPLRLAALSLALLSTCALVLSLVGVAGVVGSAASRRRREIGLRRALGAGEAAVRREMTRCILAPVLAGVLAGAVLALFAGRVAGALLPPPAEPAPLFVLAVLPVLVAVAAVAASVPARRASRVDPCEVLRAE